jgi:hypothetical protein
VRGSPEYKAAAYLLLPLMWVNLTAGENHWAILGLGVGQLLYWIIIGLGWYVAFRSPYQKIATAMLLCAFALRPMEAIGDGVVANVLRLGALAGVFTIAGAWIYGRDPNFLHRQLVVFLGLCVPIMLLQILGVSSFVLGWSTAFLDDQTVRISERDLGTFRDVPLYPTLLVAREDLIFSLAQGRPGGLMHANNIISIFVSIAVALNLVIPRSSRLRAGDLIITAAAVLAMSKMVFALQALLYVGVLLFAPMERKVLTLKLFFVFGIGFCLYYLLFPGLLQLNLSEEVFRVSFMLRLLGVLNAIGVESVGAFLFDQALLIGRAYREDENYSDVAALLSSDVAIPALLAIGAAGLLYLYRMRQMGFGNSWGYAAFLFVCVATQFAVPFTAAASFQLLLGLALFPLFPHLWRNRIPARKSSLQTHRPSTSTSSMLIARQ